MSEAEALARKFHEAYERLAPSFGYETRTETRNFDPSKQNGKLMIAVCAELLAAPKPVTALEAERDAYKWLLGGIRPTFVHSTRRNCGFTAAKDSNPGRLCGMELLMTDKADYVRAQSQTRGHTCHWPGCTRQVPPAMWGCRGHWFALPAALRQDIWNTYRPGQEKTMNPTAAYLEAAKSVQAWIAARAAAEIGKSL